VTEDPILPYYHYYRGYYNHNIVFVDPVVANDV